MKKFGGLAGLWGEKNDHFVQNYRIGICTLRHLLHVLSAAKAVTGLINATILLNNFTRPYTWWAKIVSFFILSSVTSTWPTEPFITMITAYASI